MDIELKLIAEIEGALGPLMELKGDMSNLGDVTKKTQQSLIDAFKKPGSAVGDLLNKIKPVAGSLLELHARLDQLKEKAQNVNIASEEFRKLKTEIKDTQNEIGITTGRFDEFGKRIKKGAGESIQSVFEVGEAVVGIFNLAALAGFGEKVGKESELAEKAIKGLVVLQSVHAAGIGLVKAQEVALDLVEKGRAKTKELMIFLQKVENTVVALYTGEVTLATVATKLWGAAVAFATGPIGIALAVIGAVVGAMILFTDSTKDNTEALIDNAKAAADAAKSRDDLLNKIDELRVQIEVEKGLLNEGEAQRTTTTKAFFREREALEAEHHLKILELRKDADLGSAEGLADYQEKVKAMDESFYADQDKRYEAYKTSIVLIDIKNNKKMAEEAEQERKKREALEKQRNDKIKALRKELADALADLESRGNKAVLVGLSAREQLFEEARQADKAIDDLVIKIKELNRLNGNGAELNDKQAGIIAQLRFANAVDYQQKVTKLTIDQEHLRNSIILNAQEKELADFNTSFEEKKAALVEAGASEEAIAAAKTAALRAINQKYAQDDLTTILQIEQNRIDSSERGFESETEFERRKAALKLQLAIQIKQAQIDDLNKDPQGNRLDISNLEKEIFTARKELEDISKQQDPISLASLLGLDKTLTTKEVQEFNDAAASIVKSVTDIASAALKIRQDQLDQEKDFNNQIIDDLNRRIDEEEKTLDREIDARNHGFAANVDGSKKALAELKKQRDKELEEKKHIQEEEAKIARQQAVIQAIIQAANLATAGAQLFQKSVQQSGAAGVFVAIAAIAAMVAGFVAMVAEIKQATKFEEGGWVRGRSHREGGTMIEAEDGEHVTRKKSARKYGKVLEAINADDFRHITKVDLMPLLRGTGVELAREEVDQIAPQAASVADHEASGGRARTSQLEERIISLDDNVRAMREEMTRPRESTTNEGHKQIRQGNHTTIVKKNG